MKYPMDVLEDVVIKVSNWYVPVDFMTLEMEEEMHTSIILGRPFLTTFSCRIDVKNG